MESPIQLIERNGRQIVLLDLTNVTNPADGVQRIARAKAWFAQQTPDGSLRVCSDATGSRYDQAILEALKDLASHNIPYVGVAAVVVPTAVHRVAMNVASLFSKRRFTAFSTRDPALDWLAAQ
ncbi:MAG TPA: hypothetical protein VFT45_18895 [Longimicrobium sp.]|nr:hypothetical protein [Longimicrobium sp.]